MTNSWVFNASPLILLGKAELLGVVSHVGSAWYVPNGVIQELERKTPACRYLAQFPDDRKIEKVNVFSINSFVASWNLGKGESEVISFALSAKGVGVVLDDLQARKCATVLDLPLIGTLGLLLRAKRMGILPMVGPALKRLISV